MVVLFINSKELLENLILVISSKGKSNVIKEVGYNMGITQQTACLVVNPITLYSYGFLFNCTTVG